MRKVEIFKEFTVDSAHSLPHVPEDHKCRRVHGHTYHIRVVLEAPLHPTLGWVADFADIKKAFEPVKEALDHHYLNDIPGLENPTAEHIAIWVWDQLIGKLPDLKEIRLNETPTSGVVYRGN